MLLLVFSHGALSVGEKTMKTPPNDLILAGVMMGTWAGVYLGLLFLWSKGFFKLPWNDAAARGPDAYRRAGRTSDTLFFWPVTLPAFALIYVYRKFLRP